MSTAISSPSAHLPASQPALKPCQRSCRGLMLYFPPSPHLEVTTVNEDQPASWRSSEPMCIGLSAAKSGPNLDLQKLHEAREVPSGQHVDFSVVLGHAVYQTNNNTKVLPPGCMTGLEFMRFCKIPMATTAVAPLDVSVTTGTAPSVGASSAAEPETPIVTAAKALTGSVKNMISIRILTSSADTNARLSKIWSSIVDFDPQLYADKFEARTAKNLDAMTKWLRDLQDALFKPKA